MKRVARLVFCIAVILVFCNTSIYAQQAGLFSRLTTTEPSSASATIAGGIVAGVTRNQIIDYSGRIPALTSTYFVSLDASALTNLPAAVSNLLSASHTDTVATIPVLGMLIYGNATPQWQTLAGNVTATKMFLNQTGTGVVSAAPVWAALVDADIPDTITLSNITQITTRSHASMQDLTADDHTVYALLAGRAGGQTLKGGTAVSDGLSLQATSGVGAGAEFIKFLVGNDGATEAGRFWKTAFGNYGLGIGTAAPGALLHVAGSMTVTATNQSAFKVSSAMTDAAFAGMQGLSVLPTFTFTDNNFGAYGTLSLPTITSITAAKTVANIYGAYFRVDNNSTTGAITSVVGFNVGAPFYGASAVKPANIYGAQIENQGATGVGTAVGIAINKPTNATNNYYMSFDTGDGTDPTGGGGAATGRLAVLIGGVLRYIPYY